MLGRTALTVLAAQLLPLLVRAAPVEDSPVALREALAAIRKSPETTLVRRNGPDYKGW